MQTSIVSFSRKKCKQRMQTKKIKHNGTFTSILQMAIFSIINLFMVAKMTTLKRFCSDIFSYLRQSDPLTRIIHFETRNEIHYLLHE